MVIHVVLNDVCSVSNMIVLTMCQSVYSVHVHVFLITDVLQCFAVRNNSVVFWNLFLWLFQIFKMALHIFFCSSSDKTWSIHMPRMRQQFQEVALSRVPHAPESRCWRTNQVSILSQDRVFKLSGLSQSHVQLFRTWKARQSASKDKQRGTKLLLS